MEGKLNLHFNLGLLVYNIQVCSPGHERARYELPPGHATGELATTDSNSDTNCHVRWVNSTCIWICGSVRLKCTGPLNKLLKNQRASFQTGHTQDNLTTRNPTLETICHRRRVNQLHLNLGQCGWNMQFIDHATKEPGSHSFQTGHTTDDPVIVMLLLTPFVNFQSF